MDNKTLVDHAQPAADAGGGLRKPAWRLGLAIVVVIAATVWGVQSCVSHLSTIPGEEDPAARSALSQVQLSASAPVKANAAPRTLAQLRGLLQARSRAGGAPVAGDWCVLKGSQLAPCSVLRARFEYYFHGLGELTPGEARALTEDESRRINGEALTGRIMQVFDQYQAWRQHAFTHVADPADRRTWMPALQEQRQVREKLMGAAWTKAFFEEEDKELLGMYAQLEASQALVARRGSEPLAAAMSAKDAASAVHADRVARYGAEVAQQLDKAEADQAEFDQGMQAARAEWSRLAGLANLSDIDREAQIKRFVDEHFDQADRGRALSQVKLPGR